MRRLVRREPMAPDETRWDPKSEGLAPGALDGVDAVVHLAGENIAGKRWTKAVKESIRASRVDGTRLLAEACAAGAESDGGPRVLVCASATGIFGDRGTEELDEGSAAGAGFLAEVCQAWEAAADPARAAGVRVVHGRLGMVLSRDGGGLAKMLPIFRAGAGGRLGSGRQYVPYVALPDAVAAYLRLIDDDGLVGPVHVVAPEPVTSSEFARALGAAVGRPAFMPAPAFALRLALGEMADELLLAGQRVVPRALLEAGFEFAYPGIGAALGAALEE